MLAPSHFLFVVHSMTSRDFMFESNPRRELELNILQVC